MLPAAAESVSGWPHSDQRFALLELDGSDIKVTDRTFEGGDVVGGALGRMRSYALKFLRQLVVL